MKTIKPTTAWTVLSTTECLVQNQGEGNLYISYSDQTPVGLFPSFILMTNEVRKLPAPTTGAIYVASNTQYAKAIVTEL